MEALGQVKATMASCAIVAAIVCWATCWLLLRFRSWHAHLSTDQAGSGIQKVHAEPTPRIGGLALLTGLLAADLLVNLSGAFDASVRKEVNGLLLAGLPALIGGLAEDLTRKVGPRVRLLLTMIAGALGYFLVHAEVQRIDVAILDPVLQLAPVSLMFTMVAVGGASNGVNIIDGFNGLASGVCTLLLAGIAMVAAINGDLMICLAALNVIGVTLGFMCWNWPWGRLFLGDGGAYLLGFWVAELAILLVARHAIISAWFPVLLMIHPIFETLFSMFRRTLLRGKPSTHPDNRHLHQLVFSQLEELQTGNAHNAGVDLTRRNAVTAIYFWGGSLASTVIAVLLAQNVLLLFMAAISFSLLYVFTYNHLARRSPSRHALASSQSKLP